MHLSPMKSDTIDPRVVVGKFTVFDVGGNKYRLIAAIHSGAVVLAGTPEASMKSTAFKTSLHRKLLLRFKHFRHPWRSHGVAPE